MNQDKKQKEAVYYGYVSDNRESSVVFLLKRIMHDQYEYIDYFIYELDYGRKYEPGMITDENGQDIDIRTPNLLYDFISNKGVMCQKEV